MQEIWDKKVKGKGKEKGRDVIGFGALNMDKIYRVDSIPQKDEEVFVTDVEIQPGGSAANTIVGLARLGMGTGILGKLGDDEDSHILLKDLQDEGVDTTSIITGKGRSGKAMVLVDKEGNRAIIVDPGVNDSIQYDEIDVEHVFNFRLLHLTSFICHSSQESLNSQNRLFNEFEGKISFDPGMVYARRGIENLKSLIARTDIFMPNRTELEILSGENYAEGALRILEEGAGLVVVKLGKEGCYITNGEQQIEVPAEPVKVVDTTGAGDAFNSGFIYGYLNGLEMKECGKLGNLVAARCIQHRGARKGLPHREEIF